MVKFQLSQTVANEIPIGNRAVEFYSVQRNFRKLCIHTFHLMVGENAVFIVCISGHCKLCCKVDFAARASCTILWSRGG